RFLARKAEQLKHFELKLAAMDTDRAAAHLFAVEHHVVSERAGTQRLRLQDFEIVGIGRGERMIDREEPLLLFIEFEQREIDDPEKLALTRLAQIKSRAELQSDLAEDGTDF